MVGLIFCERFNYAKGTYMWVSELAAREGHQGKGYGKKALKYAENIARKKGIDVIQLLSREGSKATALYEKLGFKKTGFISMEKVMGK